MFSPELPEKAYEYLETKIPVEKLFTDQWRQTEVALKTSADLHKIRELLKDWDLSIEATGFAIHLLDKGHEKMAGVRKASLLMGVSCEEIEAFGDSDNDVSMLKGCGFGVAVANASKAAKDAADYVSDKAHADGVIDGLKFLDLYS